MGFDPVNLGTSLTAMQTFTVTQEGASCAYVISPPSRSHGFGSEAGSVSVSASSCCGWTATSTAAWVTITSGSSGSGSGSGNGTVNYSILPNDTCQTRTGTVTIDDRLVRDSIPISPKDATWGASHFRLRKIGMLYSSGDGVSFGDFSVK